MQTVAEALRSLNPVEGEPRESTSGGTFADVRSGRRGRPATPADHDLGLVGRSAAIAEVRERILRYAPLPYPVLILGETGTGKELVARALHARSPRAGRPFVVANAAAFTDGLLASELFGHARGAFTGAVARHRGLFEAADGGTLFLDEVAEMPAGVQACVLRAIEHGEVRPLGAERERRVDVRVIAATNADLSEMLAAGRFRHDLYRRLSVLRVVVPPLRARRSDVPLLARHFLARHAIPGGPRGLTDAALEALSFEPWPGNVREIGSVIVRAAAHGTSPLIDAEGVKAALAEDRPRDLSGDLTEASLVESALARARGNVSRAARLLGVPRSTLRDRLRRFHGAA